MSFKGTKDSEIKLHVESGVFYYRGTPKTGDKNIMRSLGVKNLAEAQKKKRVLLEDLRGFDLSAKKILFGDYVKKEFLPERRKQAPKTYEQAVYSCNYLLSFFERHYVHTINDAAWNAYVDWCEATKKRSLDYDRRAMKMIFHRLHRAGTVRQIPLCKIPPHAREEKRCFTKKEIELLVRGFQDHPVSSHKKYVGIILMMYKMGMRPGEVTKLQWDRVDFEKDLIKLRACDTKTRTARDMKMDPEVRSWLKNWNKKNWTSPWVFIAKSKPSSPLNRTNKVWERMCIKLALPKPNNLYCLRHSFLTEAGKRVLGGAQNVLKVCKYAGTSIEIFERHYLHLDGSETADVAGIITEPIFGDNAVVKNL